MKTKVLVAQLGARKHYQEPLLFYENGILELLYTDFYSGHSKIANFLRHSLVYNRLPDSTKKILDRYERGLKNARIKHFPLLAYNYSRFLKQTSSVNISSLFRQTGQEFCKNIINEGLGNSNVIYGFNGACLELFKYAKKQGLACILDQTLADYSLVYKLLSEEEKKWPCWSISPFSINREDLELMYQEHEEQDLADHIVCGSSYVKDSLIARGVQQSKITVIPLGRLKETIINEQCTTLPIQERGDRLRILFAGTVGLRKGIPYLLASLSQLDGKIPFTCKIVGSIEIKAKWITKFSYLCEFLGRVPRSQMQDLYHWADVLVLPSLCEGSAMVTYEALSLGIPIITTYNSGSLVRDQVDGFIVPTRNAKAITDKLLEIYSNKCLFFSFNETLSYLEKIVSESSSKLIEIIKSY